MGTNSEAHLLVQVLKSECNTGLLQVVSENERGTMVTFVGAVGDAVDALAALVGRVTLQVEHKVLLLVHVPHPANKHTTRVNVIRCVK